MREYLTPEEVAAALKVNKGTVYGWLRAGTLPGVRINRLWRVAVDELEAALSDKPRPVVARGRKRRKKAK